MNAAPFRKIIEDRISELKNLSEKARSARAPVALDQQSVGRLSRQDALQHQAMALAQEKRRQQELVLLERALDRLEKGEYGYCDLCGEPIPEKRLQIDPATTICVACRA